MGKKDKLSNQPTATFFKSMKLKEKMKNKKEREGRRDAALASKPDELASEIERLEAVESRGKINPKLKARLDLLRVKRDTAADRKEAEAKSDVRVDMSRLFGGSGVQAAVGQELANARPAYAPPKTQAVRSGSLPAAPPAPATVADDDDDALPPGILPTAAMPSSHAACAFAPPPYSATTVGARVAAAPVPMPLVQPPPSLMPSPAPVPVPVPSSVPVATPPAPHQRKMSPEAEAAAPPKELPREVVSMVPAALRVRRPPLAAQKRPPGIARTSGAGAHRLFPLVHSPSMPDSDAPSQPVAAVNTTTRAEIPEQAASHGVLPGTDFSKFMDDMKSLGAI